MNHPKLYQSTVYALKQREVYGGDVYKNYRNWRSLVDRIGLEKVLEGHEGCVNTLRWNRSGTLLVSGSDDQSVKIWDLRGKMLHSIATGHAGNVFSAEFLPHSGDNVIVSSAADCTVRLHLLEYKEEPYVWKAKKRVKRLAIAHDEPHLVWSAAEDGQIRQHDTRTYEVTTILKTDDHGFKSLAICSERTEYLAVAPTSEVVPVYDRRNMTEPMIEVQPGDADASTEQHYPTHVGFDKMGNELLVNIGGRAVYVFDIKNPKEHQESTWNAIEEILSDTSGPRQVIKGTDGLIACTEKLLKLLDEKRIYEAIDAYTMELKSEAYDDLRDQSILLAERGMARLMRGGDGDSYAALKDSLEAMKLSPNNRKALFCMARTLANLKQWKLASRACRLYRAYFPQSHAIDRVENRISGFEDSINTVDSKRDYKERYIGQRNNFTDIKEAAFFGGQQGYILAGSDCGSMFIWDRKTGVIHSMYNADEDILNIVQPHPTLPIIATSGIEDVIRVWAPMPVENYHCDEKYEDPYKALSDIHHRMDASEAALIIQGHQLMRMFEINDAPVECVTQ